MEQYKNLSGKSGVRAFELGTDSIRVQFTSGSIDTYTNTSAGSTHIARMKQLARDGSGLNGYITRYVRDGYASHT
ncbi:MAG: hypothetical protein ABI378_09350 [Chitinophagaceae bacterium]